MYIGLSPNRSLTLSTQLQGPNECPEHGHTYECPACGRRVDQQEGKGAESESHVGIIVYMTASGHVHMKEFYGQYSDVEARMRHYHYRYLRPAAILCQSVHNIRVQQAAARG